MTLVGVDGPSALVPPRVAALLERHGNLSALRVRTRGVDPEATRVLEALHYAALSWRSSVTGTEEAPRPELTADWLSAAEAADVVGISSRGIRKAISEGRLEASLVGTQYRISRESLEHYRAARTE